MIRRLRIYLLGLREFRLGVTTHFDYPEIETYDSGREMAHRLTLRHWDDTRGRKS